MFWPLLHTWFRPSGKSDVHFDHSSSCVLTLACARQETRAAPSGSPGMHGEQSLVPWNDQSAMGVLTSTMRSPSLLLTHSFAPRPSKHDSMPPLTL